VGKTVEEQVETERARIGPEPRVRVCLLGPVQIFRDGAAVVLPRSRKVRALLSFLALEGRPVSRSRLCDLLWLIPDDPRSELRWCLSKLRGLLDEGKHRRVIASGEDAVSLELSDCLVDAVEVERAVSAGLQNAAHERLEQVRALFGGELLEGASIDGNAEFNGWLAAQRNRFRALHVAVLAELTERTPRGSDEMFRHVSQWLTIAPFDRRAHEQMLTALLQCGRLHDAEEHATRAFRAFEQEGLDWAPLRDAWQSLRRAPAAVAAAPERASGGLIAMPAAAEPQKRRRGSVAVMPFVDAGGSGRGPTPRIADGVTEDVITRLAKLRALFVIARGTVYALGDRGIGAREAGRLLNVDYVVSGRVRRHGDRASITVELAETEDARIVWTDEFDGALDDTFAALDAIVNRIVAAIAEEVESEERNRAILKPPSSLDAWEAYHRGLFLMYRFNGPDNALAEQFFRRAIEMDSTFSRAYAGLSFTHFQNAFLGLSTDHDAQIALSLETAAKSLTADDRDPAAHWAMGRALWLHRRENESIVELERSIELSPNFALGHYTLGFVHSQSGDPAVALATTDYSRRLSPFDPLLFAMMASRALAHVRRAELSQAAEWAVKAAGRPNAHAHILAIAAECLALADRRDEARQLVERVRERVPGYGVEDFLRAFRFDAATEATFRRVARGIGFAERA
jgi:DNA-binding SARP family transcriptional activator